MKRTKLSSIAIEASQSDEPPEPDRLDNSLSRPSMVAKVLDVPTKDSADRALVRWRTPDGRLVEQSLSLVKGLVVAAGDLVVLQQPGNWPAWIITHVIASMDDEPAPKQPSADLTAVEQLDVKVDGRRVRIEAQDEILLQCGKASITLRRNGRVIIRGVYVESRSSGTNRIKGGAVLIN